MYEDLMLALTWLGLLTPLFILSIILLCYWRKIWIILITLPRDISILWRLNKLNWVIAKTKKQNASVASLFDEMLSKKPDAPCIIYRKQAWTYQQIGEYSWRIARVFKRRGFLYGDAVALMCTNRPEFVCIWLGLSRLGVITALINTNLKQDALNHSLSVVAARAVIASVDLCPVVLEARDSLKHDCQMLRVCGQDQTDIESTEFVSLNRELEEESPAPITDLLPPNYKDPLLYIYTSGTTGLPKAAKFTNARFLFITNSTKIMLGLHLDDRVYTPMPLYHTTGGMLGIGPALCLGLSTVIREKFSASAYFKDCAENECTVALYIGEMCRYLLSKPPNEWDKAHKLRLMTGIGLRSAIWTNFTERFNIPAIAEIYGSTEGNANMVNYDGTVGAVGALPNCVPKCTLPLALVKVDADTKEIIRSGKNNYGVRCKPGEIGMIVGQIHAGDAVRDFEGYINKEASRRTVVKDLFRTGDRYFLTGDLLQLDEKGYLYFKDRTGDTFRWKGENVSTSEVEAAVSRAADLRDVCVFGVQVPHTEGRAGMAVIVDKEDSLDVVQLLTQLDTLLPVYAQPVFLRIVHKIEMTSTYKMKKVQLQKEGFNPEKIEDKLYMKKGSQYEELTNQVYEELMEGKIRI